MCEKTSVIERSFFYAIYNYRPYPGRRISFGLLNKIVIDLKQGKFRYGKNARIGILQRASTFFMVQ